jgi:glycosyltransferase involved in cell wall biosynthesis
MNLCTILPCHNEAETCADVVEALKNHVGRIIAIDDGSSDRTYEILASTDAHLIAHEENMGKGWALLAGFRAALEDPSAEAILTIDADMQHDPAEIENLARRMPADLIIGHRRTKKIREQPLRRKISNFTANALLSLKCGCRIPDSQSGFRIYSRAFAKYLVDHAVGGRFEWETRVLIMAARQGFSIAFAPISMSYPKGGRSSFRSIRDSVRIAHTIVTSF